MEGLGEDGQAVAAVGHGSQIAPPLNDKGVIWGSWGGQNLFQRPDPHFSYPQTV
jgi:hypothetical protein